jgi:inner membrane protein
MEPVTHLLTGACLARTGLNRRAAYATLTMVVAAEFPDVDTLWGVRGPVAEFEHHRGITHTFLGLPFEAALIVLAIYGLHRWRVSREAKLQASSTTDPEAVSSSSDDGQVHVPKGRATPRPLTAAPVRWGWLYIFALLALLSHLLLDYNNNYGLRPFYPFNSHWYSASIVFIFDPLIFAMLLAGLVAPALFGLVNSEVGVRRPRFRGRGWAGAALLGVLAVWTLRAVEHTRAMQLAMAQSIADPGAGTANSSPGIDSFTQATGNGSAVLNQATGDLGLAPPVPPVTYLSAQRALANPDPLNPFRWAAVIDFGSVYQLAEIDTRNGVVSPSDTFQPKPGRSPAVLAAEASPLGSFYMNWAPMPFLSESGPGSLASDSSSGLVSGRSGGAGLTVVTFRDPRFMGPIPLLRDDAPSDGSGNGSANDTGDGSSPLSAAVTVDAAGRVVRQSMGAGADR